MATLARSAGFIAVTLVLAAPLRVAAQTPPSATAMGAMDSTDRTAVAQAHDAMSGPMMNALHMRMTRQRAGTAADSARAGALVTTMRGALERYRDVRVAQADGFRQFLPGVPQAVYHFTNWRWGLDAMFDFDPARPTSLLYRAEPTGGFVLVGAMYTAPARASEADLDRRVPLAVARWHQHVNWCVPPRGARDRWHERRDGHPVFGPRSPIATRTPCDAVGGRFLPRIFGWMVHVNAFASDDPAVIWGAGHDPEGGHGP